MNLPGMNNQKDDTDDNKFIWIVVVAFIIAIFIF